MPTCQASRVLKTKGKWDRYLPCRAEAKDGPYCEEHTPICPEDGCDSPTYPTQKYIQGGWRRTRKGLQFEGQMMVCCSREAHLRAMPVPKHLRPPKPKRQSRRGF